MNDIHHSTVFLKSLLEKVDGVRQVGPRVSFEESVCSAAAFLNQKYSALDHHLAKNHNPSSPPSLALTTIEMGCVLLRNAAAWAWDSGVFLSGQKLSRQPKKMDEINRHDYQFLSLFSARKYYNAIPWVHNDQGDKQNSKHTTSVTTFMDGSGHILVKNFSNGLPIDLFLMTKDRATTWDRWLILLHETAHCALRTEDNWFCPTPGYFSKDPIKDKECIDAVNTWTIGLRKASDQAFDQNNNHNNTFCARAVDEAFSDAYAAMMLLKESSFDKGALDAVARLQAGRALARDNADKVMSGLVHPENAVKMFDIYAPSSMSLRHLIENQDDWKDLSPLDIKQKAKEYASNALLDYINPRREMVSDSPGSKKSLPTFFLNALVPSGNLALRDNLYAVISTEFARPSSEDTLTPHGFKDHPLADVFREAGTRCMQAMVKEFQTEQEGYARLRIFFDDYSRAEVSGPSVEPFEALQKIFETIKQKTIWDVMDGASVQQSFQAAKNTLEACVKDIFEKGYSNQPQDVPDPCLSVEFLRKKRQERLLGQNETSSPVALPSKTP